MATASQRVNFKRILCVVVGLALGSSALRAQYTFTWQGTSNDPTSHFNWSGGDPEVHPTPFYGNSDDPDSVIFTDALSASILLPAGSLTIADITFSAASTDYTIGGTSSPTLTVAGDLSVTTQNRTVSLLGSLVVSLTDGSHFVNVATGSNVSIAAVIQDDSDSSSLEKTGCGSLTLTGASLFSGGLTVDAGTLYLAGSSTFDSDRMIVTSGPVGTGTLTLLDGAKLSAAPTSTVTLHNTIQLGEDGGTVTVDTTNGSVTLLGDLTGSAELKKTGSGSLTLGGNGDSDGGVAVHAGTLFLASSSQGSDSLTGPVGSGTLKLYNGTTLAVAPSAGAGITLANEIVLDCTSSSNVTFDATSRDLILLGSISGSAGITINAGTNSVLLNPNDSNSYEGPTLVNTGTLLLGNDYALPNSTAVTVASGATLDLNGYSATIASLSGAGQVFLTPGDGENSLTVGGDGSSTTFSGVISGATVGDNFTEIEKAGSGTLTLSGANTFSGGVDLEEGTLQLGSSTIGSPGAIISGPVGTGTLILEDGTALVASIPNVVLANDINLDGGTFHMGDETATNLKLTGTIYGDGEIDFRGGSNGTLTLSGDNSFDGGVSVHSGTLLLGSSYELHSGDDIETYTTGPVGALGNSLKLYDGTTLGVAPSPPGTILLANAIELDCRNGTNVNFDTTNGDLTLAGQISGAASLTKLGQGVLSLTNDNTYTGNTYINQGYVKLGNDGTSGSITGDVIFQGNTGLGGGELEFIRSDSYTFNGNISGPGRVSNFGSGTITLSGSNTYSGDTFVHNGTLADAGAGNFSPNSAVYVNSGAAVQANFSETVGGLDDYSGAYGTVAVANGATLTISTNSSDSFTGVISGSGGLVKTGSGTQTLSGNNTYGGGTTVSQGTLVYGANGAFGTGGVTINGGGISVGSGLTLSNTLTISGTAVVLGGNGTIGSAITADSHVVISPGNSPGNLTFSAGLTLASGGAISFQVYDANGPAGTGYDLITVSGGILALTASANTITFNLVSIDGSNNSANAINFNPANSYSWTFATSPNSLITGFNSNQFHLVNGFTNNLAGGTFSFSESGDQHSLLLNFTPAAVPEPSTWALLVAGLGAVTMISRRRRRT